MTFEVVIPTRNRPEKLGRCLAAIAVARGDRDLPVLIGDSSDDERHREILAICSEYDFVRVRRHNGSNVAAARNFVANAASADVLISIDDDTRIEPAAIDEMIAAYERSPKPCAVAGTVAWDGLYHRPVVIRRIGFGRPVRPGEKPDFLITALVAFPRELAVALPWNDRVDTFDDIFIGALWRSHGVNLCFAPEARSVHDDDHQHYGIDKQGWHIYMNLFIALYADPDLSRALSFEILGFMAGAKLYCRSPRSAARYLRAWAGGHLHFLRDSRYLRALVRRPLPPTLAG